MKANKADTNHNQLIFKKAWRRILMYHIYFRRSGLYKYILWNAFKGLLIISALVFIFIYIQRHVFDIGLAYEKLVYSMQAGWVLFFFLVSETFLGLIPPDIFIVWSKHFDYPFGMVLFLAVLSYTGGFISFKFGELLQKIPPVSRIVHKRYKNLFSRFKQWGGLFIIIAAIFPIPFSLVCYLIGMTTYPSKKFLVFALARFLRFIIYGVILYLTLPDF